MTTNPSAIEALVQARHEALHRAAAGSRGIRLAPVRRSLRARLRLRRRAFRLPVWKTQTCEHGTVAVGRS
jgi:hypothetical protein